MKKHIMRSAFSILMMSVLFVAGFSHSGDRKLSAEHGFPGATSLQSISSDCGFHDSIEHNPKFGKIGFHGDMLDDAANASINVESPQFNSPEYIRTAKKMARDFKERNLVAYTEHYNQEIQAFYGTQHFEVLKNNEKLRHFYLKNYNQGNHSFKTFLSTFEETKFLQLAKDLKNQQLFNFLTDAVSDAVLTNRVKAWEAVIKHADLRINVNFLENIKDYSDDLLLQLDADLLNSKYTLKELFLESPDDVTDIWKALKDDPSYHWELFDSDGFVAGSRWEKWSQREFFKDVTKKGKDFELDILTKMGTRSGPEYAALLDKVPDLDDRYLLSQVQFCLPGLSPPCTNKGEFFIADQVWIKYDSDGDLVDMVIVDSKLSQGTNFTPGQTAAKNNVGGDLSYKPISSLEFDDLGNQLPTPIVQGTNVNTSAFYKAYGDGNGNFIDVE